MMRPKARTSVLGHPPLLVVGLVILALIGAGAALAGRSSGTPAPAAALEPTATSMPITGGHSSSASSMREVAECPECFTVVPSAEGSAATAESTATETAAPEPTATPLPTETPPPTPTPMPVPPFEVPARAVAILDAQCGDLIYGKDEHAQLAPASLTKIITALAAIDHVNLGDMVVSDISARELKQRTRSSVMGLEPNTRVTVEDLLYGLFLPSGNDAAIMIAKHVSGSVEAFSALMNETAMRLGLTNSFFDNPHGLDSPGLRSSAYDMALAGMALMQNQTLATIANARSYTLGGGLSFNNGNKLLAQYPGAYGVKIGNTRDAGMTIVGAAARDGRNLYIAVFDSDDLYVEAARLLDWAFTMPSPCGQ